MKKPNALISNWDILYFKSNSSLNNKVIPSLISIKKDKNDLKFIFQFYRETFTKFFFTKIVKLQSL